MTADERLEKLNAAIQGVEVLRNFPRDHEISHEKRDDLVVAIHENLQAVAVSLRGEALKTPDESV